MKYLKTFENIKEGPKVGDYVKIRAKNFFDFNVKEFFSNNIGKITKINKNGSLFPYLVKFDNQTPLNYKYLRNFEIIDIEEYAPSKELLQLKLDSKKYNL